MAESAGMMLGLSFGLGVVVGLGLGLRLAPASGSGYQAWLSQQQQKLLEKEARSADGMVGRSGYHIQRQGQQEGLCPRCSVSSITSASVDEGSFDGSAAAYQSFSDRSVDTLLLDDPPEFDLRAERRRWSINPLFVQAPAAAPGAAPEEGGEGGGGGGGGGEAGGGDANGRVRPSDCRTAEEGDQDNLREERSHRQHPHQHQQQRLGGDREKERGFDAAAAAAADPLPSQESPTVILRRLKMIIKQVETTLQRADMELEALKQSLPRRLCPPLRGFCPELLASIRAAFLPKLMLMKTQLMKPQLMLKKTQLMLMKTQLMLMKTQLMKTVDEQFWLMKTQLMLMKTQVMKRQLMLKKTQLMLMKTVDVDEDSSKVWACEELISLYNETNTLLVDECAYKIIKNPPYTSMHPPEYVGNDKGDNALGEGGLIREELKRFQGAASVQSFARASPLALKAGKLTELSTQLARAQLALLEEQRDNSRTTSEGTITPESSQEEGSCATSTNGSSRSTSKSGTPRHQLKRRSSLDGSLPPFRAGGVLRRLSLRETNIPTRSVTQPRSPGSKARAPAKLKDAGSPFV
ncbi:hypothetical protein CBR_g46399 [Chara braunii]|uniref:Uncharacterized protein n=1 Tax=Chara braunii TaxID=69332 RepID=A0A388M0D6_CHABU|nr:hypothetical protein CBR_g46399 [Chara braunii]|eukprot:GBG88028.1 hypothetical protein CBR_g46399 [Chara braunii]